MAELEYSGFMKDFLSLAKKDTHPFCFFDRHISVSDQNRNLQILAAEIFKDSEGLLEKYFLIF